MVHAKLLDGAFSVQLKKYVEESVEGDPLWPSKYLLKHPQKCISVHRDFVLAGSDFVSTGTYQLSVEGYKTYLGLDKEKAQALIQNSVKLVRDGIKLAEKETGKTYHVQVAGTIGPYGAYLHDKSEYTGSYCNTMTEEQLMDWHRPRLAALVEGGVDMISFMTIPCFKEAQALLKLLKEFPSAKAWLCFSVKDTDTISDGENFCETAAKCWDESDQLIAVGANCFHPSLVTPLFRRMRAKYPFIPAITCPSNGDKYDTATESWIESKDCLRIYDYVEEWFNLGISIVGGCCPTTSDDIVHLAERRDAWIKKRRVLE